MSLCTLILSLETQNDVQSVALHSQNVQVTSKGSDQTAVMLVAHTTLFEIPCHGSYMLRRFYKKFSLNIEDPVYSAYWY